MCQIMKSGADCNMSLQYVMKSGADCNMSYVIVSEGRIKLVHLISTKLFMFIGIVLYNYTELHDVC